jgi:hypothetical protein
VVIEVGNREYVWACASEVPAAFYMAFVVLGIGNLIILNKKRDEVQGTKKGFIKPKLATNTTQSWRVYWSLQPR